MDYFVGQGKKEAERAFENMTGKMCGKVSGNISNEEAERAFENVTGNSQAGKTEVGNLYDRHRSGCRNE